MISSQSIRVSDPLTGRKVEMLELCAGELRIVAVPERCMDLYFLQYRDVPISLTDRRAGIVDPSYRCEGAESFSRSFFAGMLTTCGLIQAGRPCEENGRSFGLHGCVGHLPAQEWRMEETPEGLSLCTQVEEKHPEGEHLLLERVYRLRDGEISWQDRVTNLAGDTPFMMMYHINFGAPFLSETLRMKTDFAYAENRDTGLPADHALLLSMAPPREGRKENVYYTRLRSPRVELFSPDTGLEAELTFDGFDWMGIWKNYAPEKYGLGLEPCACPGLGRTGARNRGLLPALRGGETHLSGARLCFRRIEGKEVDA